MYCGKCGIKMEKGAQFCAGCGYRTGDTTTTPVAESTVAPVAGVPAGPVMETVAGSQTPPGIGRKNFRELRGLARTQIKGNIGILFLVSLLWGLMFAAFAMIDYFAFGGSLLETETNAGDDEFDFSMMYMGIFLPLATFLLNGVMRYGEATNKNRIFKNEGATVGGGFAGFKRFGDSFVAAFVMNLFVFLWSLLLVIPGIIKMYSYSMTFYILQETRGKGPVDCITESRRIMSGNKMRLFGYDLYFGFFGFFIAIFTLGIGLIWWIPFYNQTRYNFYQSIKG